MTINGTKKSVDAARLGDWFFFALFLLAVLLSCVTTYHTSQFLLDGDASSELVLSHYLSETNQILSDNWYYSTELRVLNTQLVYAPLFKIFTSWHIVRFAGAMMLQAILVFSFWCLSRRAGFGKRGFFLGATLLLLPTSVAYGRIVLYHCFYVPHIATGFFLVALYLSIIEPERNARPLKTAIYASLFALLSLLSGLGGIRQGLVTQIPLLIAAFWLVLQRDMREGGLRESALWRNRTPLLYALLGCAAFAIGFFINGFVLADRYTFDSYTKIKLGLPDGTGLTDMLFGFLHQFGFRRDVRAMSPTGLLSLGGLFAALCCLALGIHALFRRKREDEAEIGGLRMAQIFFASSLAALVLVFLFTVNHFHYVLYFIPTTVWIVPLLASYVRQMPVKLRLFDARGLLIALVVIVLLANGLFNVLFFLDPAAHPQEYAGLGMQYPLLMEKLSGPVDFVEKNGYDLGYSSFWPCNTVVEMTDGKLRMIGLDFDEATPDMKYLHWLARKDGMGVDGAKKAFVLLLSFEEETYLKLPVAARSERVYADEDFVVYALEDASAIVEYIEMSTLP